MSGIQEQSSSDLLLDMDNEDFLRLIWSQTDDNLANMEELLSLGEDNSQVISILEKRRAFILEKFKENNFELPISAQRAKVA